MPLLVPFVFDLAEESGAQDGVGPADVCQGHGKKLSPDFERSIFIYGADLFTLSDDQVFVAVPNDQKAVAGFASLVHLPRNSDPVDLQLLTKTALNRTIERNPSRRSVVLVAAATAVASRSHELPNQYERQEQDR